jgi:hypothetical protein
MFCRFFRVQICDLLTHFKSISYFEEKLPDEYNSFHQNTASFGHFSLDIWQHCCHKKQGGPKKFIGVKFQQKRTSQKRK